MRVLALDLATKTGWALWDGARIESGVQDFTPQRGDSPGMRYHLFNRWLTDMAVRFDGLVRNPRVDLMVHGILVGLLLGRLIYKPWRRGWGVSGCGSRALAHGAVSQKEKPPSSGASHYPLLSF